MLEREGREDFRRSERLYGAVRWGIERFPVNSKVINPENLDAIRDLLKNGKIVTAAIDHKSYADVYTLVATSFQDGFNDLVERATFVIGVRYSRKFPISLVKGVVRIVDVVPHKDKTKFPDSDTINQLAIQKAHNAGPGSLWAIAPEGARSDGPMESGRFGAKEFWHGEDDSTENRFVIPIAIEGTEDQWPKGKKGLYFLREGRHIEASFIFGKPVKVADVDQLASELARGDEELFKRYQVEVVMGLIAAQHLSGKYPGQALTKIAKIVRAHHLSNF